MLNMYCKWTLLTCRIKMVCIWIAKIVLTFKLKEFIFFENNKLVCMLTNLMAYNYGIILSRLVYQTDDKEVHNLGSNSFWSRMWMILYFFLTSVNFLNCNLKKKKLEFGRRIMENTLAKTEIIYPKNVRPYLGSNGFHIR